MSVRVNKKFKEHHAGLLSNYCGLGGSGPVQHKIDALCKKHDEMYDDMLKEGRNPYLHFNEADQWMVDELGKIKGDGSQSWKTYILEKIIPGIWKVKAAISPNDVNQQKLRAIEERLGKDEDEKYAGIQKVNEPIDDTNMHEGINKRSTQPIEVSTDSKGNLITPPKTKKKKEETISPRKYHLLICNDGIQSKTSSY